MTSVTFPDVLGDVRTWLRQLPSLTGYTDNRVFFRIPDSAQYPLIRVFATSDPTQPGETPVQDSRLSLDVIGGKPSDFAKVDATVRILRGELHYLSGPIGAETYVLNAQAGPAPDIPDPDTGAPRKVLDVVFTVRSR